MHRNGAEAAEDGGAILRDEEDVVLRIDHDFHIEGVSGTAARDGGVTAGNRGTRPEDGHAGGNDILAEEGRVYGADRDGARERLIRIRGESEGVIIVHRSAGETGLLASGVEDVSGDRVIPLHEEDDASSAGQVAFIKTALTFFRAESRGGEEKQRDERYGFE